MKRIFILSGGFYLLGFCIMVFTSWDWLGGFVAGTGAGITLGFYLFKKEYTESNKREVYVYKDKRNR